VAAFVNNYSYDDAGEEDFLTTESFDLTSASAATLSFDLAKAQFSTNSPDALRVEIATNCESNFTSIYYKTGADLATVANQSGNWDPSSAADWRNEQIDLTAYLGEYVQFRFVNITGYGNSTFIDNINVSGVLGIHDNALGDFTIYPNPATGEVYINLSAETAIDASIVIANNLGQIVQTISNQELGGTTTAKVNISGVSTGVYFITITSQGFSETKKLIIE
jgi:hypothetical protein